MCVILKMKMAIILALALVPSLALADTALTPIRSGPDTRQWTAPSGPAVPDTDPSQAHTPSPSAPK